MFSVNERTLLSMFNTFAHSPAPVFEATRDAALEGDAEAQFGLGVHFATDGAQQNFTEAIGWYHMAADQNHYLAQFNLSQMYALGHGIPKSDAMARMWLRRAADGGDAGAQYELAQRCARTGLHGAECDGEESRVEAYKWFTLAGAQVYRDALLQSDAAAMRMSREEMIESQRRVAAFVAS